MNASPENWHTKAEELRKKLDERDDQLHELRLQLAQAKKSLSVQEATTEELREKVDYKNGQLDALREANKQLEDKNKRLEANQKPAANQSCHFFLTRKGCRNGDGCRFSHEQ